MNKFKMWIMVSVITAAFLMGCSSSDSKEEASENDREQKTESSLSLETEPDSSQIEFEGTDIEGNKVSSSVFSGSKLTMINVWATYCNPCLSEMPGLSEISDEYDPGEFQVIGIISDVPEDASQEMTELAAELIEQTGADYTHLLLNESLYKALLTDVTAVPTTFFIDENGMLLDTVVGAMEKEAWEERINELLEE